MELVYVISARQAGMIQQGHHRFWTTAGMDRDELEPKLESQRILSESTTTPAGIQHWGVRAGNQLTARRKTRSRDIIRSCLL